MNRTKLLSLLLTSVVLSFSSIQIVHAQDPTGVGSIGIRIAQIPAEVADHPYSRAYIVMRLQPGDVLTQRLEVFNTSTQNFKVSLYPGLAKFVNGKFEIGEGRAGNVLTGWTKLAPDSLVLKPGETKAFNMTISPPTGSTSKQHFGVIWAEVQGAANASGITSVSRVGVRMYIPIGDAPEISIAETNATSTTNELIVKKSLVSTFILEIIGFLIFLAILLFFLFLFFLRRGNSDRKFRKENEKRLEAQWKQERARRRKIWDKRKNSRRNYSSNYDDHYEEEN